MHEHSNHSIPHRSSKASQTILQQAAALSEYLDIQMHSSTYSASIAGFPTDTAPITNTIGFILFGPLIISFT